MFHKPSYSGVMQFIALHQPLFRIEIHMKMRRKLTYTILGAALTLGGMYYAPPSRPQTPRKMTTEHEVDAIINAVRKGEFSTVQTLIEGRFRQLVNARAA